MCIVVFSRSVLGGERLGSKQAFILSTVQPRSRAGFEKEWSVNGFHMTVTYSGKRGQV